MSDNLSYSHKIGRIVPEINIENLLAENKLECHFQPIIDATGKIYGYESFVRCKSDDGSFISGEKIINASKEQNIQHILDKHLLKLAAKTFSEAKLQGVLFLNIITGFIQVPAKYFEGLAEVISSLNIHPRNIVLDISEAQKVYNIDQISSVISYCNSTGYQVALDDIHSIRYMNEIFLKTRPDYVKLDRKITSYCVNQSIAEDISDILKSAHDKGCKVLAEGIEGVEEFEALKKLNIDLYQGYYLGKPKPSNEIISPLN